jgi:phage gp36-like protein
MCNSHHNTLKINDEQLKEFKMNLKVLKVMCKGLVNMGENKSGKPILKNKFDDPHYFAYS